MCKNNSASQHILKYTVLIPSWCPANTNGIVWECFNLLFHRTVQAPSISLQLKLEPI